MRNNPHTVREADLLRSLCRSKLSFFVKEFWGQVTHDRLHWNWHMDVVCDELESVYRRIFLGQEKDHDLLINCPPGTSKSILFSIMAPAWAWTHKPDFCFIGASYSYPLAVDLSRKCRDVVKSDLYRTLFPEVRIRDDCDTKGHFVFRGGGERYAVGSQGSVLGKHADFIGMDDPIDPNRTASEAELYSTNEWIRSTLSQRKKNAEVSVMGLIMQRLHQDDPSAQMLTWNRVRHVCLPATLEYPVRPPELALNYKGGLLDPVRLGESVLQEKLVVLGESGFAGQYGEQPVPAGGGAFKTDRLRWGRVPDSFLRVVRAWDKAGTKAHKRNRKPAWTVGVKMGLDHFGRYWVLDVVRVRLDSFAREDLIRRTAGLDGRGCVVAIEQEPGSGGMESAERSVKRLLGFTVKVVRATSNKEARADEFSVAVNGGHVWLPDAFHSGNNWLGWARDYVDELKHWPNSTYLDQGDASGLAFSCVVRGRVRVGALPRNHHRGVRPG